MEAQVCRRLRRWRGLPRDTSRPVPLDMGRKPSATSNALAVQVDAKGKVKYDAIARQGHNDKRIVHASFKDLIPLRQRSDVEISLNRPSEEEVAAQTKKTKDALEKLVNGAVAAQKPKNVQGITRSDATYVRYTPANQMGDVTRKNDRIMKIMERQKDPLEPPKFKHKKIPRGPPSPPPPVMHSPPRKLTAEDQEAWKIPPPSRIGRIPKGIPCPWTNVWQPMAEASKTSPSTTNSQRFPNL